LTLLAKPVKIRPTNSLGLLECAETYQGGFPDMLVGSRRVSRDNDRQMTEIQRDALLDAGVDPVQLFLEALPTYRC
jgi:hypothetical protein